MPHQFAPEPRAADLIRTVALPLRDLIDTAVRAIGPVGFEPDDFARGTATGKYVVPLLADVLGLTEETDVDALDDALTLAWRAQYALDTLAATVENRQQQRAQ